MIPLRDEYRGWIGIDVGGWGLEHGVVCHVRVLVGLVKRHTGGAWLAAISAPRLDTGGYVLLCIPAG